MSEILNLAMPFFGLILLGVLASRVWKLPDDGLAWLNIFLVYFALPALIFLVVSQAPFEELVNWPFVTATTSVTLAAFLPDTDRALPHWDVALALAFETLVSGGLLQELTFRALVLYALLRAWRHSPRGALCALLVSSVLFSAAHVVNLASGAGAATVGLQLLDTVLAGLYLGFFVVHTGSVWPAVLVHGLGNAAVTVMAAGTPGFVETPRAWLTLLVLKVPVYLYVIQLARLPASVVGGPGGARES